MIENNHLEDIEQLLQPACAFHASEQVKKQVLERAQKSVAHSRNRRIFTWIAAACVAGFIFIYLKPPKMTTSSVSPLQSVAKNDNAPSVASTPRMVETKELARKDKEISRKASIDKGEKNTLSKVENATNEDESNILPMSTSSTDNLFRMSTDENQPAGYEAEECRKMARALEEEYTRYTLQQLDQEYEQQSRITINL